jgi:hypothetical protein
MRIFCLMMLLVFFVSGPGCKKSQEEPTATSDEKVIEKIEKTPELSDAEKDKLKSLGYVE